MRSAILRCLLEWRGVVQLVAKGSISKDFSTAPDHFHNGNRLLKEGDKAGAELEFRHAINLNPTDPAFFVNLGSVLAHEQRLLEAESAGRSAVNLAPYMARAHMALGQVWLQGTSAKQKDGLKRMARALTLDPKDPEIRLALGREVLKRGRIGEAVPQLWSAVQLRPQDAVARDQLGYALSKEERLDEARLWLESAENFKPSYTILAKLIEVLLWLGDDGEARRVAKRAVEQYRLWLNPMQRPTTLYRPELFAKPRWAAGDVAELQKAADFISREDIAASLRAEFFAVQRLRPGGWRHQPERIQEPGVGRWKEWKVLDDRQTPCREKFFPKTCRVVQDLGQWVDVQWAEFSVLEPGAHIRPHTGPTNDRLTLHFCLADGRAEPGAPGVRLRVGDAGNINPGEYYRNGTVLFLDDSFEHEVWHNGAHDRVVLLVQFSHPGQLAQPGSLRAEL